MSKNFAVVVRNFVNDESGQGITEYGAILAFVAVLVTVVAGFVKGGLTSALSNSFSSVVSALNALNSSAAT